MFKSLSPGAVGIRATLSEALDLASAAGFDALALGINEAADLVDQHGPSYVTDLYAKAGLRIGSWGFPVQFRKDDQTYQADMAKLPRLAAAAEQLGATRCATWMLPFSDELRFTEHFELMVQRLRPAAQILADHGIRFGLEFVGPRTMREGHAYRFISSTEGMLGLCSAIGTGNMGLLFDSFHWYTSYGTAQDIASLRNEDIVLVHLNDAYAGRTPDEQIDNQRAMPGETGVIDLSAFLTGLAAVGYDGPVVVEPFSERVRAMAPQDAAQATIESMRQVYRAAGLS